MADISDVDMKTVPTKNVKTQTLPMRAAKAKTTPEKDVKAKTPPKKAVKLNPKPPSIDVLKKRNITTKTMIQDALVELNTRKGVSLQAIKKFLHEKYSVDTEKRNYLIKKYIKSSVESGSVIQIKGIGASGSFKLAVTNKDKKKTKKHKDKKEKTKKIEEKKHVKPKKADTKVVSKKSNEKDGTKKKVSAKVSKDMQTRSKQIVGISKRKSIDYLSLVPDKL